MTKRRTFIKQAVLGTAAVTLPGFSACANSSNLNSPKISLAQWSLHRAFKKGELKAIDFASITKGLGINAVEYVSQFYSDNASNEKFWSKMQKRASDIGVENVLMMVDEKEKLGDLNDALRKTAVEDHYKWVDAAKILGCHSIRVNAFGIGTLEELTISLTDGLGRLTEYAEKENIFVILENHGLHTSNAAYMANIIKQVNNPFLGTLPDFGNWCTNAEWGGTNESLNCTEIYDPAKGLAEWMPYAKGVSAKTYEFDTEGNDTIIDYPKLLQIVKDANFEGHIGIESEGNGKSETEGIKATKELIEKVWKTLD